jgi:hypothetical protein
MVTYLRRSGTLEAFKAIITIVMKKILRCKRTEG